MSKIKQLLYLDNHLAELYDVLDQLHTAASEGSLPLVTTFTRQEMVSWLRDVIYTAQETITELNEQGSPMLRIVEKRQA